MIKDEMQKIKVNKLYEEPLLFCICGPAGSGKSTVCRKLLSRSLGIRLSISTTTRSPRGNEQNGREYYFVSAEEFKDRIEQGRFIEWAEFNGNYYGTEMLNIDLAKVGQEDLLLDIDVQGVKQLKKLFLSRLIVLFIFPPSFKALEHRLRLRATESEDDIQKRLSIARKEIEQLCCPETSDYLILNVHLKEAVAAAEAIVLAERCRLNNLRSEMVRKIVSQD